MRPADRYSTTVHITLFCFAIIYVTVILKIASETTKNIPEMSDVTSRLIYTIRWQTMSLTLHVVAIFISATKRLTNKEVLLNSKLPILTSTQTYITNEIPFYLSSRLENNILKTIEQFVFNAAGQLIMCTYLTSYTIQFIPYFTLLFCTGRLFYITGSLQWHSLRIIGHTVTLLSSLILYLCCVYYFFCYSLNYEVDVIYQRAIT